jgi:hypothetical protein
MVKQPPQQQQPLQDTTAATIKALTGKINRLESNSIVVEKEPEVEEKDVVNTEH